MELIVTENLKNNMELISGMLDKLRVYQFKLDNWNETNYLNETESKQYFNDYWQSEIELMFDIIHNVVLHSKNQNESIQQISNELETIKSENKIIKNILKKVTE